MIAPLTNSCAFHVPVPVPALSVQPILASKFVIGVWASKSPSVKTILDVNISTASTTLTTLKWVSLLPAASVNS